MKPGKTSNDVSENSRMALQAACLKLFSCWSYSSMEAKCSPETSVDLHRTTWRCVPEDRTLHSHLLVNPNSNKHHIVESEIEENTLAEECRLLGCGAV
jgi:hypothetical protein